MDLNNLFAPVRAAEDATWDMRRDRKVLAVWIFLRAPAGLFGVLILLAREKTLSLQLAHISRQIEARESKIAYLESLNAHRRAQHAITVALASAVARAEAAASEALCGRNCARP